MGKATDLNFSVRIELKDRKPKNAKLGQMGVSCVTWPIFLNFGIPAISLEWVWLDTSNWVCGLTAWYTNQKCKS